MDTFAEIIQAVQDDMQITDTSPLYPLALVKRAINRAYRKAGALYKWPELEDAKKTSSVSGQEYYDYPQTWRSDTIFRLEIGGVQYGETPDGSPMDYNDYLEWRQNSANTNSTEKKWANQWRRFFVYPVPTSNGTNDIVVWGFTNVTALSGSSDTTIFSYSMPECNEAIVMEAVAILKNKGELQKEAQFLSLESKTILASAWNRIKLESAKYEKVQPFFEVNDMFGNSRTAIKNNIGDFN